MTCSEDWEQRKGIEGGGADSSCRVSPLPCCLLHLLSSLQPLGVPTTLQPPGLLSPLQLLALSFTFAAPRPPSAFSPWVSSLPSNSWVSPFPCSSSGTGVSTLWVSFPPGSSPLSCTHTSPRRVSGLLIQPPSLLLPCIPRVFPLTCSLQASSLPCIPPVLPAPRILPGLPFPCNPPGLPSPFHPPGLPSPLQVSKPPLSVASPRSALQPLRILSPWNPPRSSSSHTSPRNASPLLGILSKPRKPLFLASPTPSAFRGAPPRHCPLPTAPGSGSHPTAVPAYLHPGRAARGPGPLWRGGPRSRLICGPVGFDMRSDVSSD